RVVERRRDAAVVAFVGHLDAVVPVIDAEHRLADETPRRQQLLARILELLVGLVALESQNSPLLATLGAANAGAAANPVAPRTAARARNESFFMIELHVHIGEEHGECRAGSSAAPVTSR